MKSQKQIRFLDFACNHKATRMHRRLPGLSTDAPKAGRKKVTTRMCRRLAGLSIDAPKAGCKKRATRMRRRLAGLSTYVPKAGCEKGTARMRRRLGGRSTDAPKVGCDYRCLITRISPKVPPHSDRPNLSYFNKVFKKKLQF